MRTTHTHCTLAIPSCCAWLRTAMESKSSKIVWNSQAPMNDDISMPSFLRMSKYDYIQHGIGWKFYLVPILFLRRNGLNGYSSGLCGLALLFSNGRLPAASSWWYPGYIPETLSAAKETSRHARGWSAFSSCSSSPGQSLVGSPPVFSFFFRLPAPALQPLPTRQLMPMHV